MLLTALCRVLYARTPVRKAARYWRNLEEDISQNENSNHLLVM
jgi:hypothetical protein